MHTPILDASGNPRDTRIVLRTRLDNDIDNVQPWWYSHFEWNILDEEPNKFERLGAKRTSEANPVYNCHGLTFGNRRAQIAEPLGASSIALILRDDGFEEIPESQTRLGDVVVYYGGDGSVDHSGIVVGKNELGSPLVWSKWGKGYEMLHTLGTCPYYDSDNENAKFYRILKWQFQQVFGKIS